MNTATIHYPEQMNEFEMIQVSDYMAEKHPGIHYTMTPGNQCIYVYFSFVNLYFIFRGGKIVDVQID